MAPKPSLFSSLTRKFKKVTKGAEDNGADTSGDPANGRASPAAKEPALDLRTASKGAQPQPQLQPESQPQQEQTSPLPTAEQHEQAGTSVKAGSNAEQGLSGPNSREKPVSQPLSGNLSDEQMEQLKAERAKVAAAMKNESEIRTSANAYTTSLQTSLSAADISRIDICGDKAKSADVDFVRHLKESLNERTTTIAVANHCPPEILSENWAVEDFSLRRKVYEGGTSVVCEARHRDSGHQVALKIYKRSRLHEMERFQLAREICLHVRVLHPHVISLYMAWKDNKYVYLCMEWAPLGNLLDYLVSQGGKLSEKKAVEMVVKPMLLALEHLHRQNFIHRDIKLENIIVDEHGKVKLADFGLSIDQKFEQANTRLGTFGYFAPEILDCPLKRSPFDYKSADIPSYDCKVDIWSLGVVTYEVLTGSAPFTASTSSKILLAIRNREIKFPDYLSPEARNYLECVLERDPEQRWSASQLLDHPWIQKHGS